MIEPDELVLTVDEIEHIVGEAGSSFGDAAELLRASGGSPLLLRAILAGSRVSDDLGESTAEGAVQGVIADYLNGLFRRQDAMEQFASVTSVPDDLDAASAQRLSGLPEDRVTALLDSLEAEGGLVMRRDISGEARYRLPPHGARGAPGAVAPPPP